MEAGTLLFLAIAIVPGLFILAGLMAFLLRTVEEDPGDNEWLPPTWVFWSRSLEKAQRHLRGMVR
jgi:hypothetical protein